MANTIAIATGFDKSGRVKTTHRLGSATARAEANTYKTFAAIETNADGSGVFTVTQNGSILHKFAWGNENMLYHETGTDKGKV